VEAEDTYGTATVAEMSAEQMTPRGRRIECEGQVILVTDGTVENEALPLGRSCNARPQTTRRLRVISRCK
jgi:hypothetical protein